MKKNIIIAVIAALIAGALVMYYGQMVNQQATESQERYVTAYVAAADIAPNTEITADMVTEKQIPTSMAATGTATASDQIVGNFCESTIPAGEQFYLVNLKTKAEKLSLNIPQGSVAITVGVTDTTGVAYGIQSGDAVDIYATYMPTQTPEQAAANIEAEQITKLLASNVPVLKSGTYVDVADETGALAYSSITLSVTPDQAAQLIHMETNGTLTMALRSDGDTNTYAPASVTITSIGA